MKKIFKLLCLGFLTISVVACSSNKSIEIPDSVLDFDLTKMSTEDQEKHDNLVEVFKSLNNESTLAFGTTTTANIFNQLGLNVAAAPESVSLDKDLTEKQVAITEYEKGDGNVVNLGSALTLNLEAIVKMNPDYFVYSDAMMSTATNYSTLEENGIKLVALPQSNYQDMFIVIDAMKAAGISNEKLDEKVTEFSTDLEKISTIVKDKEAKSVALIQVAGGQNMSIGNDAMLGKVAKSLGIKNIFETSATSALNSEKLLSENPDLIFHYTHSMQMGTTTTGFEDTIQGKKFQTLDAVKNKKVVAMGNDSYAFSPSVDLNITKMMLQLVENAYE
ncbi:ABC transporter substrate-binding protein [Mycoplasma sp. P36-A1]|uniref:ABC transporter substrate-binding protein n=1 Tax=Mycoplasma sp. P36-A1 TaxID=3252900 RepID=UPI003C2AC27C